MPALSSIQNATPEAIATLLHDRCSNGNTFTLLGSRVCLSVNPENYTTSPLDRTSKVFVQEFNEDPGSASAPADHVFQIVGSAYRHMACERNDQTILLKCVYWSLQTPSRRAYV